MQSPKYKVALPIVSIRLMPSLPMLSLYVGRCGLLDCFWRRHLPRGQLRHAPDLQLWQTQRHRVGQRLAAAGAGFFGAQAQRALQKLDASGSAVQAALSKKPEGLRLWAGVVAAGAHQRAPVQKMGSCGLSKTRRA